MCDWIVTMNYVDDRDVMMNKKQWALNCERLQALHPEW